MTQIDKISINDAEIRDKSSKRFGIISFFLFLYYKFLHI